MPNTPEKLEVTYACGHSAMLAKSQREAINETKINAATRALCEPCLTEHKVKREGMISNSVQRTKEAAAATKLTGTKKQIEWADRIREKWLYIVKRDIPPHSLKSSFEKAQSSGALPNAIEHATTNVLAARLAAIDEVLPHNKAAWWIEFREYLESMINNPTDEAIKSEFAPLLNRKVEVGGKPATSSGCGQE
jgi:hypothetical protein